MPPWPDAECRRQDEAFPQDPVRTTDSALKTFRNLILPQARASQRSFPGYNHWMTEVGNAIRRHEVTDAGEASAAAQLEFKTWVSQFDVPMANTEQRAAIQEQTQFRLIAKRLTKQMRCQTDERRAAAIDHFSSAYALRN